MTWARTALVLALLGGTLGAACDAMHVISGTTRYTPPSIGPIAWWTFPLFAGAAVALGLAPIAIERAVGRIEPPSSGPQAGGALLLFVLAYLVSCVQHGALGAITLAVIAILAWSASGGRPVAIAHALGAAVAGPLVEIALVRAGLFAHAGTELAGVAIWLPCLYLSASVGVATLARWLLAQGASRT